MKKKFLFSIFIFCFLSLVIQGALASETSSSSTEAVTYGIKYNAETDKNEIYKNLLPPLKLLSETDKKELILNLNKLDFNIENLKAA